jgi:small GTP-binding protein
MSSSTAISCKVVILGESGVGKTCIINRYINNTFNPESMTTSGASYASKTMYFENYEKNMKFDIWDTAGQEKFRSLTKIFYKETSVAILVYDVTRKESFEEVTKYWYHQIKDHSPKNTSKL